jgi:CheY-like chemotaxis protein
MGVARILIDEPSPAVRGLIVSLVEWLGHTPLVAGEAWDGDGAPDAALIEPGQPGDYASVRSLFERWPTLPVVALGVHPHSQELAAMGVSGFVAKPFALPDFERALAAALDSR